MLYRCCTTWSPQFFYGLPSFHYVIFSFSFTCSSFFVITKHATDMVCSIYSSCLWSDAIILVRFSIATLFKFQTMSPQTYSILNFLPLHLLQSNTLYMLHFYLLFIVQSLEYQFPEDRDFYKLFQRCIPKAQNATWQQILAIDNELEVGTFTRQRDSVVYIMIFLKH